MRTLFASLALCVVSFILGVVGDLARPEQPRPQSPQPRGARVVVAIPPAPLALSEAQAATAVNPR